MVQQLRTLVALKDLGVVSSTHMVAHKYLQLQVQKIKCLHLTFESTRQPSIQTIHARKIHKLNFKQIFLNF